MPQTTWQPTESLTMAYVGKIYKTQQRAWPTSGTWSIDLSQNQNLDSAGIALLLAAIRHAQAYNIQLTIVHWSDDAQLLIQAQGLNGIFQAYSKD